MKEKTNSMTWNAILTSFFVIFVLGTSLQPKDPPCKCTIERKYYYKGKRVRPREFVSFSNMSGKGLGELHMKFLGESKIYTMDSLVFIATNIP